MKRIGEIYIKKDQTSQLHICDVLSNIIGPFSSVKDEVYQFFKAQKEENGFDLIGLMEQIANSKL